MAEKKDGSTLELTEPCWMCATHLGNGGFTTGCDTRCAYAYLKKEHDEVMDGLRKIHEKVREQGELIRRLSQ